MVEQNPILKPFDGHPASLATAMVIGDSISLIFWTKIIGGRWPRIARAGLYLSAGVQFWLAYGNWKEYSRRPIPCTVAIPLSCGATR